MAIKKGTKKILIIGGAIVAAVSIYFIGKSQGWWGK